jgi:hypothetical protein
MRSTSVASVVLGLAAGAFAAPAKRALAPRASEFTLAITVNGQQQGLTAVASGTANTLDLVAQGSTPTPGELETQDQFSSVRRRLTYLSAFFNGTGATDLELKLDLISSPTEEIPAGVYGVTVPGIGDSYGTAVFVTATPDSQDTGFSVGNSKCTSVDFLCWRAAC